MTRSSLVAFCLVIIGVYGVLYAVHAGRSASNEILDLKSQLDDIESKVDDLDRNEIADLTSKIDDVETKLDDIVESRGR